MLTGDPHSPMAVAHPSFMRPDHVSHPLHLDPNNDWIDANCYTDLWIELLHRLGLDPLPLLSFTLGIDYEGDQWTFFKPPLADLQRLYGIEVVELMVYRSLCEHAATQLRLRNLLVMEADAYFLPDVPDTFRRTHSKTTIAVVAIDPASRAARYLHNSGCFTVRGEDFDGLFRLGGAPSAGCTLPPYVEVAKLSQVRQVGRSEHVGTAVERAAEHVARPGREGAMARFLHAFDGDLRSLAREDTARFDGYAFATLRQLGAACALGSRFVSWLDAAAGLGLSDVAQSLDRLSMGAKRLILKAARFVATGRPLAGGATFAQLTTDWRHVVERTRGVLGATATNGGEVAGRGPLGRDRPQAEPLI